MNKYRVYVRDQRVAEFRHPFACGNLIARLKREGEKQVEGRIYSTINRVEKPYC